MDINFSLLSVFLETFISPTSTFHVMKNVYHLYLERLNVPLVDRKLEGSLLLATLLKPLTAEKCGGCR